MRQTGSIKLFQYWNRLRRKRPAPERTEIDPTDIKMLLPDTFILDMDGRGEPVFRLAGTRLCAAYGRELKGSAFTSLLRDADHDTALRLSQDVFRSNSVAVLTFAADSRNGRSVTFEMLLLPLSGGVGDRRCLGIMTAAQKPFWLGADPLIGGRLDAGHIIDPDQQPDPSRRRAAIAVPPLWNESPSEVVPDPAARRPRRIRHLVVLDGGRRR